MSFATRWIRLVDTIQEATFIREEWSGRLVCLLPDVQEPLHELCSVGAAEPVGGYDLLQS